MKRLVNALILAAALLQVHAVKAQVPLDSAVRYGQLENGLTYYIRHNEQPAQRAEFYIVQKVGSILEEDSQRGLAHFLEHMAFHDTKNFPDDSILGYLESNGVKFGTNLNATTSVDQTVYNISNVPVTRQSLVDSCLLILHDWSGCITMQDNDIDDERRVIREEWRTRTNADMRMLEAVLPQVYPEGCRYAERLPIGLMSVVDSFPYQVLRDYYHKWYRPDLQAIIVVGDIDVDHIEQTIRQMWQDIPRREHAAKRNWFTVAGNADPVVGIASDPESQANSIQLLFNRDQPPLSFRQSEQFWADAFERTMIGSMLNARFDEIVNGKESPFINATTLDGDFLLSQTRLSFGVGAGVVSGGWQRGINRLIAEVKRVCEHGFTESEYERAKSKLLNGIEDAYANREARKNSLFVGQLVSHFLSGVPAADIETYTHFFQDRCEQVSLSAINERARQLFGRHDEVLILMGQQLDAFPMPDKEQVLSYYEEAWQQPVEAYVDTTSNLPLIDTASLPHPGQVVKETHNDALGIVSWQLSNGARVVIRHTDFRRNAIQMTATSPGGNSLYGDADYANYGAFNSVAGLGGLGTHSALELTKLLAGKSAKLQFSLNTSDEALYGSCSPKEFETMLQLVWLAFQGVRKDFDAFQNWKNQVRPSMYARDQSAATMMQDSINQLLYGNNPRFATFKSPLLNRINYRRVIDMFTERYSNAADFTFIFVGNINPDEVRTLVEQYIGALPTTGKHEKARRVIPYIKRGHHVCHFERPMQTPKTEVQLSWAGRLKYNLPNRMRLNILSQVLQMVYTETLREGEGGTYGAQVAYDISREPKDQYMLNVNFTTNAEQAETLITRAKEGLLQLATEGVTADQLAKVVKYMTKRHNDLLRENAYWMAIVTDNNRYGTDDYTPYFDYLNAITPADIQQMAKLVAASKVTVEVVMKGIPQ